MLPAHFLPYLGVAIVLVITPGPDFAMTTKNVIRAGRRAGTLTALGVATGAAVWTAASVLGLATILRFSDTAFMAVKFIGAGYLMYLGVRALVSAITIVPKPVPIGPVWQPGRANLAPGRTYVSAAAAYRQGLLCNLLNPKAAAIYTSVIPQFVSPGAGSEAQLALMGSVLVLLIAVWLCAYSAMAATLGMKLGPRARQAIDGVTGCVLIGLGLRLAVE